MEATKINSSLNFKPLNIWPANLPIYSWGPWQLTGFEDSHKNSLVVDLKITGSDLKSAIHSLYPKLSLPELARIYSFKGLISQHLNWIDFFEHYNLRFNENLSLVLEKLILCPMPFQIWCSKKDIFPKDIEILRSVEISTEQTWILNAIASSSASKSTAVQILEFSLELLGMGTSLTDLQSLFSGSPETCLNEVKKIRFPMNHKILSENQKKLESLTTINGVEVKWKRKGDQSGLELRIFAENEVSLNKKIKSIEKWNDLHRNQIWMR